MKTFFCTLGVVSLVLSAASFAANPRQACRAEINSFCSDVQPGGGRIIRCLQEHSKDLSDKCS